MKKRILILNGFFILIIIILITGCSSEKYNARMYSNVNDWILPSFLEDNMVKGAYYENQNYSEKDEYNERYYCDETSPESRIIMIKNQEESDDIFIKDKIEVDFNKEYIYLYIFADIYPNNEYDIDSISIENRDMTVFFKLKSNNKKDSTIPYQRCLIIIMEKTDISTVEFINKK